MRSAYEQNKTIPIFFAVDDRYVPYLAVAVRSIIDNASNNYKYRIYVLIDDITEVNKELLSDMCSDNFHIEFVSVKEQLSRIGSRLHLRDYYTKATYYRFFIPEMFRQYEKGIYLDCDITVTGDISQLYETRLGRNLVAAVTDEIVTDIPVFTDYAEKFLGIERDRYFNAGILLMNLKEMREIKIEERLKETMAECTFPVAQDQDYLNVICYGRVKYLPREWNKTPFPYSDKNRIPKIAHFKMDFKPWHYDGVVYENVFWQYAEKTSYYDILLKEREEFSDEQKELDKIGGENLKKLAASEIAKTRKNSYLAPIGTFLLCGVI